PPQRFVGLYSTGNQDFVKNVADRHLANPAPRGKIRFVSGSFGAGKTHFLRQLREEAFEHRYLVSTVELTAPEAPLDKFERVFAAIVREIASPSLIERQDFSQTQTPLGEVLRDALFGDYPSIDKAAAAQRIEDEVNRLMADDSIDIDFRRVVRAYWETFD